MDKDEIIKVVEITMGAYQTMFENSIRAFSSQIAQFEERNSKQHDEIINHQKETNGRVKKLEQETAVVRYICKNPKTALFLIIIFLAGIILITSIIGIEKLFKLI